MLRFFLHIITARKRANIRALPRTYGRDHTRQSSMKLHVSGHQFFRSECRARVRLHRHDNDDLRVQTRAKRSAQHDNAHNDLLSHGDGHVVPHIDRPYGVFHKFHHDGYRGEALWYDSQDVRVDVHHHALGTYNLIRVRGRSDENAHEWALQ